MKQPAILTQHQILSTTFCILVVLSNIVSAKLVKVPFTSDFYIPAGLLIYPLTFLITDLVTELYGAVQARQMVYLSLGMSLVALLIITFVMLLPYAYEEDRQAFQKVMGLSGLRILSSLAAYFISQILAIQMYAQINAWTKGKFLWLRSGVSTYLSQMIDTIVIDLLYLYCGLGMELPQVFFVMLFSFSYKFIFTLVNIPLFYAFLFWAKQRILNNFKEI